jgi:CheY-like chemotaxis protein
MSFSKCDAMSSRILIVEDEMMVAMEMEAVIEDLGFLPIGIAADSVQALELARETPDLALVDLHLRDGLTGPSVGEELARRGIGVVFITANPRIVATGVPGALGVAEKPCDERTIASIIEFALGHRKGEQVAPPAGFKPFSGGIAAH